MASIITKTIGTAGGRDYSTIGAWLAACPANLVTADQVWKGVCYNDTAFNEQVSIASHTTDATRYIWLTAADGEWHNGSLSAGVRIDRGAAAGYVLYNSDAYTIIEKIRVTNVTDNTYPGINIVKTVGNGSILRKLIVHNCSFTHGFEIGIAIKVNGAGNAINCIVANISSSGSNGMGISADYYGYPGPVNVYNCLTYNVKTGIYVSSASYCRNNCALRPAGSSHTCMSGGSNQGESNNLSTDTTALGTDAQKSKVATDTCTDPVNGDFTLKAASAAIGNGYDLSGTFTDDIQGTARTVPWDIGAFKYTAAATFPVFAEEIEEEY